LAIGIKAGGKLKSNLRRLKVKALPTDLPDVIEVDVTKLKIGMNIKVADLSLENIEFLDDKSNVVVSVNITRAARSAAGDGDDEEAEEGEETTEETAAE
jgi:large subunit ribosomal protein L25